LEGQEITPESFRRTYPRGELVTTSAGTKLLFGRGPSFNLDMLEIVLGLRQEGINPFDALWYFYDTDTCLAGFEQCKSDSFFLFHDGRIVRDNATFREFDGDIFSPSVLKKREFHSNWLDAKSWAEADTKYWYRKFYSETRIGQLMGLRSDKPELFFRD